MKLARRDDLATNVGIAVIEAGSGCQHGVARSSLVEMLVVRLVLCGESLVNSSLTYREDSLEDDSCDESTKLPDENDIFPDKSKKWYQSSFVFLRLPSCSLSASFPLVKYSSVRFAAVVDPNWNAPV